MPQLRYATWVSVWQRIEVDKVIEEPVRLAMEPVMDIPVLEPVALPLPAEEECVWALKTNLLYAALLSPSIEVEYRFAPHWSAHVDFAIAWWKNEDKHQFYQLAQLSPEVRYWFKDRKMWRGHYIGAFVGAGHYDLENGSDGYKGEFTMAGLSYGYMFPLSRLLSMEASIGVGYMNTEYREYIPLHGHYVYEQTSRTAYIGPLKAKLSLVWHLWQKKKGGTR